MSLELMKKDIRATAKKHDVRVYFSKGKMVKYVGDKQYSSGYFEGPEPGEPGAMLAVATGKPEVEWMGTLAHESSHMDQWIENTVEWQNTMIDGQCIYGMMFEWINGDDKHNGIIKECIYRAFLLERDCELRALKKIEQYDLPIDRTEYIQKSNAYLAFYSMILKHRTWYNASSPPYECKPAWSKMPKEIVGIDFKPTAEHEEALLACL